jgi:glutamate formiminotransferase/glutamate formiminotransferase/formiminotetrahydrofolate cyclodeaminase
LLLAVPNVSEGRDLARVEALENDFARGVGLLDVHSDPVHNRSVFTLSGQPPALSAALVAGGAAAADSIDMRDHVGAHPAIGALDVCPLVWLREEDRERAREEAVATARGIARAARVPVFLYGELADHRRRRERSFYRDGGPVELARRMATGELRPDFGPPAPHPSAGATLVAARPPLVAINLELAPPATREDARRVAAAVREGGADGLPGVRALGLELPARGGVAQVSCNVEDHRAVPLARLLEAVERHAPVAEAELVGLAPRAAFAGWPERVPIRNRATVEDALGS